ncbi:MAG TPA: zf-HC2 domain-containing protein [Natronosporangium sp.]|nr:zf-HC2 domain-containing protein [Natronosporangium sp.]
MGCEQVREALSARLDGEETGMAAARLEAHLAGCAGCAAWLAQAERLDRMVAHAQPVPPDLTAGILAAVAADPRTRSRQAAEAVRRTRRMILRVALAVAAAVQVVAVLPVLAGADLHLSREIASFEIAMAVGFGLAAWRPERARGFVPVAVVLAAALALTSVVDVLSARTAPAYEAGHLVAVVQAGLLWALARYERRGPRIAGPAAGTA